MILTAKEEKVLKVIIHGSKELGERWCDLDQILDYLKTDHNYSISKAALQFPIRKFRDMGIINRDATELRRRRRRRIIIPTPDAYSLMGDMSPIDSQLETGTFLSLTNQ